MTTHQVAGFALPESPLISTLGVDELVNRATQKGSFLAELLKMLDPQNVATNETAKDAYEECVKLRSHISEQLWVVCENENVASLETTMESLARVCARYELLKDVAEGDWEIIDHRVPIC
ncbi:hypothetical protein LRAMOSA08266 [Lichtheimia ramosa]|uniref:Uncharacterized protein n=1 Tax=Lichtheimia ramosa TaxID=688394 RepID=A0A077WF43_9FUNG|nr:hypothetical protein LRAMOSA08266 [Lichtheimia ramosa]